MQPTDRVEVRSPNVISEIIGGEAVIIDLDSGTYYSLDPVGSAVWALVEPGTRVGAVVDALAARFDAPREVVEASAHRFLARLREEGLVALREQGGAASGGGETAAPPPRGGEPFAEPVLSRFTDIKDLLLLDPVHEVDEDGWPRAGERRETGD